MTVEEVREYLDDSPGELTDQEVEQLVKDAEALARLILDIYLESKQKHAGV
jgi:hypothetical protein